MRPERMQTDGKSQRPRHFALKQAKRKVEQDQRVKQEKEERDKLRELERTKNVQKNSSTKN